MTESELVAAIQAAPDDVSLRRAYADWLSSHGDPLGECIALHLALEEVASGDPKIAEAWARLDSLGFEQAWFRRFQQHVSTEHGMVVALSLRANQLVPDLLVDQRGMMIRVLSIEGDSLDDSRLVVLEHAMRQMRLRRLRLGNTYVSAEGLAMLLQWCPDLEDLHFGPTIVTNAHLRVISSARLPRLTRLRAIGRGHLRLDDLLDNTGAETLAASPERGRLRQLGLECCDIGAPGAASLVDGRLALASLDVSGNPIGPHGVIEMLKRPGISRLESLAIAGVGIDDTVAAALASTPELATLRHLALAAVVMDSGLSPAGLSTLVASPYLARDLRLDLDGVALGLQAREGIDGASGLVFHSWWEGAPPRMIAERFAVRVVGWPSL